MPEVASFTALEATIVLGVVAGSGLAVVAAFLVRPARRVVVVPSLLVIRMGPAADAVRRGLARWPARLLAMLLALGASSALSLASGGPRLAPATRSRTIVAIDVSPSMAAGTRAEEARAAAASVIRGLGAGESVMVALAGPGLIPLSPWSTDHAQAIATLERASVRGSALDPVGVLRDAAAVLGPEGGRVVLVSDMGFTPPPLPSGMRLEGVRVGSEVPNAAVTRVAARLAPGRRDLASVAVTVAAFGQPASGRLAISCSDGSSRPAPAAAAVFSAGPGRPASVRLDAVPLCGQVLVARIDLDGGPDALPADDEVVVRLPAARRLKVAVAGKAGLFVRSALAVQPGVEIQWLGAIPARVEADLLIVDDAPGRVPDGVAAFLVHPRPGNGRVEVTGREAAPRFEPSEAADPLAEGLSVADVNVAAAAVVRPGPTDEIVFASTRGTPLLLRRDSPGQRTVALAFPLDGTDLGLRAAWPLLVSNVLAWAAGAASDFAIAEGSMPPGDSDLSARADLPGFTGATEGALDRLVASTGERASTALAMIAMALLMLEWAMAQRRPDLA